MTKKEKIAVQSLFSAAVTTVAEVEAYCRDYDSTELKSVAKHLKEVINEYRKTINK